MKTHTPAGFRAHGLRRLIAAFRVCLIAAPPAVQAQPAVIQLFTNTMSSGNMYLADFGWTGYRGANAANLSAMHVYIPQNAGHPDGGKGYLALTPDVAGSYAMVTTFPAVNVAGGELVWSMGNNFTSSAGRPLVRVNGVWYASSEQFQNTGTYTAASFASAKSTDVLKSLRFSTAAVDWRTFTLVPGSQMVLGSSPVSDLPSSQITGAGFLVTTALSTAVVRLDSLEWKVPVSLHAQNFLNSQASGNMYLANYGWTGYRGANAASLSAMHVYIPQNVGNPDGGKGYLALTPDVAGSYAMVTTFPVTDLGGGEILWSMGNNLTASTVRPLVQIGGAWYASNQTFQNATSYSATAFAGMKWLDTLRSLRFSTAAADWRTFTLVPGSQMTLGASPVTDLPSSRITGIGFLASVPSTSSVVRLDSLKVSGASVPPGAAQLGYSQCVYDERPKFADIAPGKTGTYKWFRGACWSSTSAIAPATNYTDTGGILTLLQKGDGKSPTIVGAPHDFNGGVFPGLPGDRGFYVEFEVRLSANDPDHWPAVWLMPQEHNGGNGQPLQDVYPGDPPGYERWMELDVDEGGFRPGPMGSVISWWGTWTPGYDKITCNSWSSPRSSTALDRTEWHTFGASYDPHNSRVTWWLDGVKYFTADNSVLAGCVPAVAKLQNFYPIIGAQTHGAKKPYSMYVRRVRAFVPPQ
jgi:hypothetical protein